MKRYAVHVVIFEDAKSDRDAIVNVRNILSSGLREMGTDGEDFRVIRAEPLQDWAQ